ncbi:MAG: rhodanese-like domain-containing protein, partial [Candidatus Methylophosphatis roskildensis]
MLSHLASGGTPIGVFTGDALFFGDVGRTDFYPDRAEEVAGLLYDSLHDKLLPLGDQALVHPAHGAGSVCGSGIASRDFSSLGEERLNNPLLRLDREAFIAKKVNEHHYLPPYFERMEAANAGDRPGLMRLPTPQAMSLGSVTAAMDAGAQLLDLRPPQAIAGACIGPAISIPVAMLASFGGWFLSYDRPIILLLENEADRDFAVRTLVRTGYDRIDGFLAGGIDAWATAGKPLDC